jgi:integrase
MFGSCEARQRRRPASTTSACKRSGTRLRPAWFESGIHIKAVSDLLGHSSISITGGIYGHTSDDTARKAVEGLSITLGL